MVAFFLELLGLAKAGTWTQLAFVNVCKPQLFSCTIFLDQTPVVKSE